MSTAGKLIEGEFTRTLDDRYRLTLPDELKGVFKPDSGKCVIVKESPGHLSLWEESTWKQHYEQKVEMVVQRLHSGYLTQHIPDLQRFGRLLSTRYRRIQLADRARFLLPEGFREFLGVEPKQDVMVVGAAICIEIWNPQKLIAYAEAEMPQFNEVLENLINNRTI